VLRFGITAWIAGGSSFLFLPEMPKELKEIHGWLSNVKGKKLAYSSMRVALNKN
jgi:hypothetical protein